MELNLSSGNLINAGGGFLFLVVGIGILVLVVAREPRSGRRLGWFAVTFGLIYALANLLEGDDPPSALLAVVLFALGLVATLCLGLLVAETLRQVPPAARRRVAALAIGVALGAGIIAVAFVAFILEDPGQWPEIGPGFLVLFPLQFLVEPMLLVLLAACGQAPLDGSLPQYKGRLMIGLAAGLFAVHITVAAASANNPDPSWTGHLVDGVEMLFGALAASTALLVLRGRPPGADRVARRAFAAIVIVGLVGGLLPLFGDQADAIGPFGIIRTVGAVLLVLAVVKYDVLDVSLPRIVVRRGPLAGGALAVLFVVAQVAQNFFSAKYGLLIGGVLAGIFVFAASPVQRAIERYSDRDKPEATSEAARAGYKAALRAAMRDRSLTRDEERHLAEVAMALGISPVQALDLRDEVERERA